MSEPLAVSRRAEMTKIRGGLALWSFNPYPCYSGIDCLPPQSYRTLSSIPCPLIFFCRLLILPILIHMMTPSP